MRPALRALLLVVAVVAAAAAVAAGGACGTPCERIRADRESFAARRAGTDRPHLVLAVPFALLDRLAAERLGGVRPVRLPLPGLGAVGRAVGDVTLAPRALRFRPARPDRVGVEITVDVRVGGAAAAALTLAVEAQPVVDVARRRLDLVLRGDDLRGVRPQLGPDARAGIAAALGRRLPPAARRLLPPDALVDAAERLTTAVIEGGWPLLRDEALVHVGELTRVSVALPDLPLAGLTLRSEGDERGGSLQVGIVTTLPVADGLDPAQPVPRPRADRVALRLSGNAAAELGNRAMALGQLPARYDQEGRPTPDGPFEAALAWRPGRRPLAIRLWKLEEPCLSARLAGAVQVTVAGGTARVTFSDGVIEDVRGPALIELGAWFHSLWADAITFDAEAAAQLRLSVAGTALAATLHRVRVAEDALTFELTVSPRRERP